TIRQRFFCEPLTFELSDGEAGAAATGPSRAASSRRLDRLACAPSRGRCGERGAQCREIAEPLVREGEENRVRDLSSRGGVRTYRPENREAVRDCDRRAAYGLVENALRRARRGLDSGHRDNCI